MITYDELTSEVLDTLAQSSQRIYQNTFDLWADWCLERNHTPTALIPKKVKQFLEARIETRRTRQRHLSAMRSLARYLVILYPEQQYQSLYEALKLLRVPSKNLSEQERVRRVLTPDEVTTVLGVWDGRGSIPTRNRALMAVLFYTGLRRAEVAELLWNDVDFDDGIIRVRHGKGDKYREVTVVKDRADTALRALKAWRKWMDKMTPKNGQSIRYVFPPLNKAGRLTKDKPLTTRAINKIVSGTSDKAGIEFTTHDTRRTHGTRLLIADMRLADVKDQLGHAKASTTIDGYAMPANARKRRGFFKIGY